MNDSDWVRSIMMRYQGRLLRYAARFCGSEDRAQEAVQEVFLRLCSTAGPPDEDRLAQWLFTVCRNAAIDLRRKERHMTQLSDKQKSVACSQPGPSELAERNESAGAAMRILRTLPANQREVIRLRFQEGFRYRQIAQITGLSVSNVGFLIHTAIAAVRARLEAPGRTA